MCPNHSCTTEIYIYIVKLFFLQVFILIVVLFILLIIVGTSFMSFKY
ncbi:hypothetical protein CHI06_27045 [Bacillus sp. 7884-1]|nr:hypothetical protein CHI06_27045 [Bacillus sp. 7884-1]